MDFKQDSGSRRCGKTNRTACRKLFPFRKQPGYFRSGIRQPEYSLPALSRMDADQTFSGHQDLDWFGEDALNVVATYNLIYNATFLVEHGIGYALCFDRLVNTSGRNLTFRPISPELSVGLYIVTKKYQVFSPAVKAFLEKIEKRSTQIKNSIL